MTIQVEYLSEETIERDAEALLEEFFRARGVQVEPAIPIEDIIEKHLKLSIDFDDLHEVLGVPKVGPESDIQGAIWVDRGEIWIDENLDPDESPSNENRYRFTLAHEGGGHWRLHRPYLFTDASQGSLFGRPSQPPLVCRKSQAKERAEWQADFYAACLLMPRALVFEAWRQQFGTDKPYIYNDDDRMITNGLINHVLQERVRPLAQQFQVSPIAMRIRAQKLRLLQREVPQQFQFTTQG